jgi:DNA topoisomerase VI subunit B
VRPVFVTSRAAEFLQVGTLTALTGQSRDRFGDVVVKELLDNAADATESAGVVPCIAVSTVEDDDTLRVTVTDNGSGMPPEVVERILNFEATASSNAAYRSPTRGLQGNAWKTIIGIAHVGAGEPVVIEACGVRHEITVAVDPGGHVRVHHRREQSDRTTGTAVTVALPIMWDVDVKAWLQSFAMINPHAELGLLANPDDGETPVSYKPTVSAAAAGICPSGTSSAHSRGCRTRARRSRSGGGSRRSPTCRGSTPTGTPSGTCWPR